MPGSGPLEPFSGDRRCPESGTINPPRAHQAQCADGEARKPEWAEPAAFPASPAGPPTSALVRLRRAVLAASCGYAALMLVAFGLIRWVGTDWWGGALLLFVPRWLLLGPLAVLSVASGLLRRPSHWLVHGVTALIVAGPLMGFTVPVHRLLPPPSPGHRLRVMTYNRGQLPLDATGLIAMLERERVDLIAFQEKPDPKLDAYLAGHWHRDASGYIASRYPIVAELAPMPQEHRSEGRYSGRLARARIRIPLGPDFIFASLHLPTLRPGLNRFLERDLHGLELHRRWWRHELERVLQQLAETEGVPLLLGGDFNMPSDDSAMTALAGSLRFAFEDAGWGYGYTRPSRYPWFRIDHLVASREWSFTRCWVGPDFGSDHLPLLAEAVLAGQPPARAGRR